MHLPPVYLDHPATTPCEPAVVQAMTPYWTEHAGNATSSHAYGLRAQAATERARRQVAQLINAAPRDIVWTSGATEANNLAILGVTDAHRGRPAHIIIGAAEHHAVLDPAAYLETRGWRVSRLNPGPDGRYDAGALDAALTDDTLLVSLMWANNETGAVQDITALAARARARGAIFHCDATAAVGKIPVDVAAASVDLVSLSAHKMYGPQGVGALWVRPGRPLIPLAARQHGGGQERGLRSGTLPVALIVGFGEAARIAAAIDDRAAQRERREVLWHALRDLPGIEQTGPADERWRLPGLLHITVPHVASTEIVRALRNDVAASVGSACTTGSRDPSHVLVAMGMSRARAFGALRLGLGRHTSDQDIERAVPAIRCAIEDALRVGNVLRSS